MGQHFVFTGAIIFCAFLAECTFAQGACTIRENSLGDYSYQCEEGNEGRLLKDALGRLQDSRTGETYRRNSLGNYQSDEGKQTWRKDSLGRWQTSEQTCRKNSLGHWQCQPK
ncbi:MAG: Uncharacterized protein AWU57_2203 [Marinobacter sp. T13-3]|jgi:hypothetical protein|nr:MAG: Uncharacterized protein AWU57_2203 [Marinobacter sp. T13-3]